MRRRQFLKNSTVAGAGVLFPARSIFAETLTDFESKRPPVGKRHFSSSAVEATIGKMKQKLQNKELAWLFENCFPNTLDTTVFFEEKNGVPDTYVITGDIDAMWMRDSTAQVWPYLPLMKEDEKLKKLIAGVIRRQTRYIHKDPYANAFYKDETKESEWKSDLTDMKPGVHERKWEIDSLCYPIRLAYNYYKHTGDAETLSKEWKESIAITAKTFREQQRKNGVGPYTFQRSSSRATDSVPMDGYGYPVNPIGLICSSFRPSDDATVFSFLVPSNFFAVVSLKQAAELVKKLHNDDGLANECLALAKEVSDALQTYAVATHPKFGKVYAYETDGFGNHLFMDDANVPSLLSLPYLGAVDRNDVVYQNTRKLILSESNPFFFKGRAGEGIGGPHIGSDYIWPLGITMRALTSVDRHEIDKCVDMLVSTHGGTGFMHESFHKDDPAKFTRKWFAWANTMFGEMILKVRGGQ
jgi:meiotically up-regulated gene 157 (Mug157) protein